MLERVAHAKINLALHVTAQQDDGYHILDTLVVFTEFGDVIAIKEKLNASSLVTLKIEGPFAQELDAGANNLVSRAALALAYKIHDLDKQLAPVEITLTKNLPVASGIGGGSADAAATLLALQAYWQSNIDLAAVAFELGADIPMCLHSKPLRAQGIGEKITPIKTKELFFMVLVNPNVEVSTPEIFKKLATKNNPAITDVAINNLHDLKILKSLRNDLQMPAIEIQPIIQNIIDALENTNANIARMSGSGATCFGLYDNLLEAEIASKQILQKYPNWWCVACATTVS